MRLYCVYILASRYRVLYVGITGQLKARIFQHKNKLIAGFTSKYNVDQLVWYEAHENAYSAIEREKQIKRWSRAKKIYIIELRNPDWQDLYDEI